MHLALLVGTVIALMLASFILLVHLTSFFGIKIQETNTLIEDVNQYALTLVKNDGITVARDTIITSQIEKKNKAHVSFYGCWKKIYVEKKATSSGFEKALLVGTSVFSNVSNLYLKNSNSPLILVGNTVLEGTIFLPKQGVKAGTISGNYYQNNQLIFGKTNYSKSELPELDPQWISYIKDLQGNRFLQENKLGELNEIEKRSFKGASKNIYKASPLILSQGEIHGNVVIKSATSITINKGVSLIDVILIAPKIKISDQVEGTFQAIAHEQIIVGNNCKLHFPSSLVVLKREQAIVDKPNEVPIEIGVSTVLEGSVVYINEKTKKKRDKRSRRRGVNTHLKIGANALIKGEVYCKGNVELLGVVKGSCYVNKFIANQFGSKYINHIYNGEIRPFTVKEYGGLPFKENHKKSIVKWLY